MARLPPSPTTGCPIPSSAAASLALLDARTPYPANTIPPPPPSGAVRSPKAGGAGGGGDGTTGCSRLLARRLPLSLSLSLTEGVPAGRTDGLAGEAPDWLSD